MVSSENQMKDCESVPLEEVLAPVDLINKKLDEASDFYKQGRYKESIVQCLDILNLDNKNIFANKLLGTTYLKLNRWNDALVFLKNNLVLYPEIIDCYLDLSFALIENPYKKLSLFKEAVEILKIGLRVKPNDPALNLRLYHAYYRLGDLKEAKNCLNAVAVLLPNNIAVNFEQAKLAKDHGDFDKAKLLLREIIKRDPKYTQAIYELFFIREFDVIDDELIDAESLLDNTELSLYQRQCLYFALFNAYDKLGNYKKAFGFLKQGNDIVKDSTKDIMKPDLMVMETFEKIFTREYIEKRSKGINYSVENYPIPIFVVSMPRSGSTLVEKILSSHSQISSSGEPLYLKQVFEDLRIDLSQEDPFLVSDEELSKRAVQYLELLSEHTEAGVTHVVDKLPLNFIFIGLIKIMFPQAKIIYLDRDPVAVGFSCYKHMFSDGQYFSFGLDDIVDYYNAHKSLKRHWDKEVQPDTFLEIQYSDLVNNSENMIRKLVEYSGLAWEEDCLKFYEKKAVVQSASLAQVRKPIYKGSNEAWKNYEEFLGDFVGKLRAL